MLRRALTSFVAPSTATAARAAARLTSTSTTATHGPLFRRSLTAAAALSATRGVSLRTASFSAPGGGGAGDASSSPLDSNSKSDAFATQHFDLQDVDADRLTHFFWDRGEEAGGSPYLADDFMAGEMDEVMLMGEDNFENAWFVDPRDRRLLFNEYLYN